ncbi:MAG: acyltransferase family protein [Weeksellaceae bacterium]
MKSNRNTSIDFLRGLAVIFMIFIHVAAYFLSNQLLKTSWNYAQAAVPFFVFCAGYVYFARTQEHIISLSYLWKRISRLLIPYYIFLIVYAIVFSLLGTEFNLNFWKKNLLMTSGIDLNWLIVLFIQLTILMPILGWLYEKKKQIFWIVAGCFFTASFSLLFTKINLDKRMIVWISWPVITIYSLLFAKNEKNTSFLIKSIVTGIGLHLLSLFLLQLQGKSLSFFDNKYPPNMLYMSYGVWSIALTYLVHAKSQLGKTPAQKVFDYFSVNSYSLFFIHFLIVYLLVVTSLMYKWGFIPSLGVVFAASLVIQQALTFALDQKKKRSRS